MKKKVKKAVIPAAGLGTRFLPATKAQPKEMLPIVDKPTLQYIIEEAVGSGIEDILIITGRNKKSIEDHFDRSIELELELERSGKTDLLEMVREISDMINIQYVRQKTPKGLGHAVLCAKNFINDEPFAVILGDDIVDAKTPCLRQLMDVYDEYQSPIIGVQKVKKDEVDRYGIVDGEQVKDRVYKVMDLVEKPDIDKAPSDIAILGRYILTQDIFDVLEEQEPGKNAEIQLTDALKTLVESQPIYAYNFEGKRYDVGDKFGFLQATVEFAIKNPAVHDRFVSYIKDIAQKI